ncbi:MAG: hypothetical protein JWQ09_4713 [Segetibacter sp.]|nr:hypothetical protein [Segetibacter sp.]
MKTNMMHTLLISGPGIIGSFFIVLLIILVLLTIIGIVYLYINSKTKERLALIEKGMDPNLAKSDFLTQVGIIGAGLAAGLILGDYLPTKYGYGPLVGIIVAGIIITCYNIYKRNKEEKNSGKRNN